MAEGRAGGLQALFVGGVIAQLSEDIDSDLEQLCAAGCGSARKVADSYKCGQGVAGFATKLVTDMFNSAKAGIIGALRISSGGEDDSPLSSEFLVDYGFVDKDELWSEPVEFQEEVEPAEVMNTTQVEWKIVDVDFEEEEKNAEHKKNGQVHSWEPAYVSPWMLPPANNFLWEQQQTIGLRSI